MNFPKIITSCAVRASDHNDVHGGIYMVDLKKETYDLVLSWSEKIDEFGRGAERGLRGIAKYKEYFVVAAASSILFLDVNFNIIKTIKNEYFRFLHEIVICNDMLYIASTGFDSIILYNFKKDKVIRGYQINGNKAIMFDPNKRDQIKKSDKCHINSVSIFKENLYFCGTQLSGIFSIKKDRIIKAAMVPSGTHNAQLLDNNSVIMNNTGAGCIEVRDLKNKKRYSRSVLQIPKKDLLNGNLNDKIARQPFARGMDICDELVIAGSSPAMISVYSINGLKNIKNIIMNKDMRYSIHGIEIIG